MCVIGESRSGKSTFLRNLLEGLSAEIDGKTYNLALRAATNRHPSKEDVVKISCEEFEPKEFPITKPHGCIVMFDVTDGHSFSSVQDLVPVILERYEDVPIVLCGNKVDAKNERIQPFDICLKDESLRKYPYVEMSARSGFNIWRPFELIGHKLHIYWVELPHFCGLEEIRTNINIHHAYLFWKNKYDTWSEEEHFFGESLLDFDDSVTPVLSEMVGRLADIAPFTPLPLEFSSEILIEEAEPDIYIQRKIRMVCFEGQRVPHRVKAWRMSPMGSTYMLLVVQKVAKTMRPTRCIVSILFVVMVGKT